MLVESSFAGLLSQQNPQIHFSFRPHANSELGSVSLWRLLTPRTTSSVEDGDHWLTLKERARAADRLDVGFQSSAAFRISKVIFLRLASVLPRARPRRRGHCGRPLHFVGLPAVLHGATRTIPSDNLTMYGMHNGLKPVLCSKLAVDVVEMVTKCLQADPKFPCGFGRILTV